MAVLAFPVRGEWLPDARDGERALRVSSHPEAGCLVLSMWRESTCVGTVRLAPAEAPRLVAALADGLAGAADAGGAAAQEG